jgi:RNA polymerase sigma-70 factor (ECF subfamily)
VLNDPGIFERAYKEHRAVAFAAAARVLRDPVAAEDVVQDSFAHLWQRPRAFDARRGSLRSYIAMVARSRAIDRSRMESVRAAAAERLCESADVAHERSAADRVIERERAAKVVALLDELPAPQREALVLAYGQDLTGQEIGRVVGVPTATAKSRVRLGLHKLRPLAEGVA